jgi:hypothetical protein
VEADELRKMTVGYGLWTSFVVRMAWALKRSRLRVPGSYFTQAFVKVTTHFYKSKAPQPILDSNGFIIGCIVPPPTTEWDADLNNQAIAAIEWECGSSDGKRKRGQCEGLSFTDGERAHRRGEYRVKADAAVVVNILQST